MKEFNIVAILGSKNCGKSTSARIFSEIIPDSEVIAFGDPLKDVASIVFGIDRWVLEGDTAESREERYKVNEYWANKLNIPSFNGRTALTTISDIIIDYLGEDVWVNAIDKRVQRFHNEGVVPIIADVRFIREINMCNKYKPLFVQIKRTSEEPDKKTIDECFSFFMNNSKEHNYGEYHRSEFEWRGLSPDFIVYNDGTFADLVTKLNTVSEQCNRAI